MIKLDTSAKEMKKIQKLTKKCLKELYIKETKTIIVKNFKINVCSNYVSNVFITMYTYFLNRIILFHSQTLYNNSIQNRLFERKQNQLQIQQ